MFIFNLYSTVYPVPRLQNRMHNKACCIFNMKCRKNDQIDCENIYGWRWLDVTRWQLTGYFLGQVRSTICFPSCSAKEKHPTSFYKIKISLCRNAEIFENHSLKNGIQGCSQFFVSFWISMRLPMTASVLYPNLVFIPVHLFVLFLAYDMLSWVSVTIWRR